jgi:hypothetical protein
MSGGRLLLWRECGVSNLQSEFQLPAPLARLTVSHAPISEPQKNVDKVLFYCRFTGRIEGTSQGERGRMFMNASQKAVTFARGALAGCDSAPIEGQALG